MKDQLSIKVFCAQFLYLVFTKSMGKYFTGEMLHISEEIQEKIKTLFCQ